MMKKAVKLEILVFMEPGLTDAEIVKWVKGAMIDYADFENPVVKIIEKHERIMVNVEANACA